MSLRDGAWSGKRAFIIGGGPSLKGVDLSRLAGELVVGCNLAYRRPDVATTVDIFYDERVARAALEDPEWRRLPRASYWIRHPDNSTVLDGIIHLRGMHGWSHAINDGVIQRSNCGLAALNFCDVMRAETTYLLGFDFRPGGTLTNNWHDWYPEDWRSNSAASYRLFVEDFERISGRIGTRVVNLNPDSALRVFSFSTLDEVTNVRV